MQGQAQEFEDAIQSLMVLMVVAVFILYVILGILYESYIHPFTVLTTNIQATSPQRTVSAFPLQKTVLMPQYFTGRFISHLRSGRRILKR